MSGKMRALAVVAIMALATAFAMSARAEQCGTQAGGALCPNCLCCSKFGWCGSTSDYCGAGCQSQCNGCSAGGSPPSTGGGCSGGVASIIFQSLFDQMLLHCNDVACSANGFYTNKATTPSLPPPPPPSPASAPPAASTTSASAPSPSSSALSAS